MHKIHPSNCPEKAPKEISKTPDKKYHLIHSNLHKHPYPNKSINFYPILKKKTLNLIYNGIQIKQPPKDTIVHKQVHKKKEPVKSLDHQPVKSDRLQIAINLDNYLWIIEKISSRLILQNLTISYIIQRQDLQSFLKMKPFLIVLIQNG